MTGHSSPSNSLIVMGAACLAVSAATLLAFPRTSLAQGAEDAARDRPEDLSVDVSACVELESAEERFACYEAQVDAALDEGDDTAGGQTAGDRAGGEAASERNAPALEIEDYSGPGADEGEDDEDEDEDQEEIVGTIAALRERQPNQYLITLEDGQIWHQTNPEPYRLRVGHRVRIYPSRWSGYRLTVEELRGFIQVERVR